jgi:hypothetical protein
MAERKARSEKVKYRDYVVNSQNENRLANMGIFG